MRTFNLTLVALALVVTVGSTNPSLAQDTNSIQLPAPQTDSGKPLMQALKERHTSRSFANQKLPPQMLSDLLWAAFGVNRPDSGKRTAPSAVNWQEIDLYVATADGLFLYDGKANTLKRILDEDIRASTGKQDFVKTAPVDLIYVADRSRMGQANDADKDFYSAVDTGFISQNVYLFCASEGLATVVIGMVDRPTLEKKMELRSEQKVILVQPVGYPRE